MTQLYASLAAVLLVAAAFFYGEHVQADQDAAGTLRAVVKADGVVARGDTLTEVRSLAAATHVQAVHAVAEVLRTAIAHARFTTPSTGDIHADTKPAMRGAAVCSDPFADPHFRVLYDAGSRADTAAPEAGDLSLVGTGNPGAPAGGVRGRGAGG